MLSHAEVQKLGEQFVWVKIDPRDRSVPRAPFQHKSTEYVPEVVFLDVRNGREEVIQRLGDRSVSSVLNTMRLVLSEVDY